MARGRCHRSLSLKHFSCNLFYARVSSKLRKSPNRVDKHTSLCVIPRADLFLSTCSSGRPAGNSYASFLLRRIPSPRDQSLPAGWLRGSIFHIIGAS